MASEGLTRGGIIENEREKVRLAQLHGDLDAINILKARVTLPVGIAGTPGAVTFEAKKHLWTAISRLTKRVDDVILNDRQLAREVIHLAAKGRKV